MNGKFIVTQDGKRVIVVAGAFDPVERKYAACHHAAIERLRLEKWWIWVCSDCFMIRDLEHMEAA